MPTTRGPVTTLDLHFQRPGTVAAFLVRTAAGPALVETGPESLYGNLEAAVRAEGFALEEVRHVFLTHIHLDHGGAAWRLARLGAQVYVHPKGAAHLAEPARLMASAERIYKEHMHALWGRMDTIPAERITAVEDGQVVRLGDVELEAIHTPGHAVHHVTWRLDDGLFTGDVGGIRIGAGPVIPPFPPPDIDLEAWRASIVRMRATGARAICATHFGIHEDAAAHFDSLAENLERMAEWIRREMVGGKGEAELVSPFKAWLQGLLAASGLDEDGVEAYETADPAFMSVQGLLRYWRKQLEG